MTSAKASFFTCRKYKAMGRFVSVIRKAKTKKLKRNECLEEKTLSGFVKLC
jgi:hypothetical protein